MNIKLLNESNEHIRVNQDEYMTVQMILVIW